jgi:hypothetical protein
MRAKDKIYVQKKRVIAFCSLKNKIQREKKKKKGIEIHNRSDNVELIDADIYIDFLSTGRHY